MWRHNTLFFSSNLTADRFDKLGEKQKLEIYIKRVKEHYVDVAEMLDKQCDAKFGFASILLSCSAIEAMSKILYFNLKKGKNEKRATDRFNDFCENELGISKKELSAVDLYGAYRCGVAHEGRIKKRFAVTYDTSRAFELCKYDGKELILLNPKHFREKYLENLNRHFNGKEQYFGEVVTKVFSDY